LIYIYYCPLSTVVGWSSEYLVTMIYHHICIYVPVASCRAAPSPSRPGETKATRRSPHSQLSTGSYGVLLAVQCAVSMHSHPLAVLPACTYTVELASGCFRAYVLPVCMLHLSGWQPSKQVCVSIYILAFDMYMFMHDYIFIICQTRPASSK